MPAAATAERYTDPDLATLRLLTEPQHFLNHMDENGNVPDAVFEAVVQNRATGSCEIAMPGAVTTVFHDVEQRMENGRLRQVILWLGKTAVEVARNGYKYHFSKPAHQRVDVEVDAAAFEEETLRPGIAQPFVSAAMTRKDALAGVTDGGDPVALAKAEHLHDDDSLRVSTAVQDTLTGRVVKRKLQSLLVRDVPFSAWVDMFKDPNNIFRKPLPVADEDSAVSLMELFAQMELPEGDLPEGPVSLIAAVLPYIKDETAHRSVEQQLYEFRRNQELYARESERAGREWALFDLELARGIKFGRATNDLRRFIKQNEHFWDEDSLLILQAHELGGGRYAMTEQLAALLSRAKQKRLGDKLCVVVGNRAATSCVSEADLTAIRETHDALEYARAQEIVDHEYIRRLEDRQNELLQRNNIRSGGGCSGEVESTFGKQANAEEYGVGENASPFRDYAQSEDRRGSRRFDCPKCHREIYRELKNRLVPRCTKCGVDVGCEPKKFKQAKLEQFRQKQAPPKVVRRVGRAAIAKQSDRKRHERIIW